MAAARKTQKVKSELYFNIFTILSLVLLVLTGVLLLGFVKQADTISKYELLEKIDNQACRYLDNQPEVNGSFNLDVNAPTGKPKLTYTCFTGETVAAKVIHGKPMNEYALGASVQYFTTNQEAEKYAETTLNPLRYWGVDEAGQNNNIPQTSKFTFLVSDVKKPYFDSYTVKANAVLRVSLLCTGSMGECHETSAKILDRELKGINVL